MGKILVKRLLAALACVLIIVNVYMLDFSNLEWGNNRRCYINIIAMTLTAVAMCYSIIKEKQRKA